MEGTIVLGACIFGCVLFLFLVISRQMVRPRDTDQVQTTWGEMRQMRQDSIGCRFWRLLAIVEFVVIVVMWLTSRN